MPKMIRNYTIWHNWLLLWIRLKCRFFLPCVYDVCPFNFRYFGFSGSCYRAFIMHGNWYSTSGIDTIWTNYGKYSWLHRKNISASNLPDFCNGLLITL